MGMRERFGKWLIGDEAVQAGVTVQVDDSAGWGNLSQRAHDYDLAKVQEIYQDALTAWRKNPIAWRIIAITTDYVIGEKITIQSKNRAMDKFIHWFWNHPKNLMDLRLESMCDELARAGDLFVLLFRNADNGMSYIRFVTKDAIIKIESAENDWETELAYIERGDTAQGERTWYSPNHPKSAEASAIMLHYSVNRPIGALLGESDIVTMIPWLQRYSRMLEDRVRLHWAIRSFLWMVTVPSNKVKEKIEQYRGAPEAGSVIIKDESEKWEPIAPLLHGQDSEPDLRAIRQLIDAGSGYPPHWRGEAADANLATATAMQAPTEKHLQRRQNYFCHILKDILYHAYTRAAQIGKTRALPSADYSELFTVSTADITKQDNYQLTMSANQISQAFSLLARAEMAGSPALLKRVLALIFKFSGEVVSAGDIETMVAELVKQNDKEE